ncbi:DsbA family protein [soil metagenome]
MTITTRATRATRSAPALALAAILAAALALQGVARAQIGADPARFVEALGVDAERVADDGFVTEDGVRVELERRGGALYAVRGVADLDSEGVVGVATVVAAATGLGDGILAPVAEFLRSRAPEIVGAGPVVVGVERFRLSLEVRGAAEPFELTFGLALAEIAEAAFPTSAHALGPVDAAVTVREFSDFQCPFCKRFAEGLMPALEEVLLARGDVRFEYHHFPLQSIHANAFRAAEASECAAAAAPDDTMAFWRFHDALFETQAAWSGLADPDAYFVGLADGVEVDPDEVERCLAGGEMHAVVGRAYDAAVALQLRGTPTVFVEGYRIEDFTEIAAYLEAIDLVQAFSGE